MALERLDDLKFSQMNDKYKRLSGRRAEGTCRWLLDSDDFRDWKAGLPKGANSKPRVLLLTGKPGCGKSVLMRAAVENESPDATPNRVVVYFWFDGESIQGDLSTSGAGFFRAMLHQLLANPNLDLEALMGLDKALSETLDRSLAASDVRNAVLLALRHMRAAEITVFLDGLDDCTVGSPSRADPVDFAAREQKTDVLSVLEFLRDLPGAAGLGVRLCLSARSAAFLGDVIKPTYVVPVDKHNGGDIWTYLQGKLTGEEMMEKPRVRHMLLRRVQKRASNTFLWVRLIVAQIDQKMSSSSVEDIIALIESEPVDLFQLYRSLLSHVGKNDRVTIQKEAEVLIRLVHVAARGLTVEEIGSVLAFAAGREIKHKSLESHIARVSCGLVECQLDTSDPGKPRQVIRFIHESVAAFVLGQENTLLSNPECAKAAQARFHFQAFQICSRMMQWKIDNDAKGEPAMLPYAKQFWMLHARKGEAAMANDPAEPYEEFAMLCGWGSAEVAGWYKQSLRSGRAAYLAMPSADVPNEGFVRRVDCLLVLLAFEGCTRLVGLHLQGECDRCCGADSDAGTALPILRQAVFLAALRGYDATVRVLLDAADKTGPGADDEAGRGAAAAINTHYEGRETALTAAVFRGHKDVVELLMQRGADAELADRGRGCHRLPLHVAVSQQDIDMVRRLLKRRGQQDHGQKVKALLEQQDHEGLTALHVAVRYGAGGVLGRLLEYAAGAGCPLASLLRRETHEGFTALHLAVLGGERHVLEKLLQCAHKAGVPPQPLLTERAGCGISPYRMGIAIREDVSEPAETELFTRMLGAMERQLPAGWEEEEAGSGDDGPEDTGPRNAGFEASCAAESRGAKPILPASDCALPVPICSQ